MLKSNSNHTLNVNNKVRPEQVPMRKDRAIELPGKRVLMFDNNGKDARESQAIDEWAPVLQKIARDKDRRAFADLFAHFAPRLKSFGLQLKSPHTSPQMAEELAQNVMLKVWLKARYFNPDKASASTWIFTIARNCRIDYLRKLKKTETPLVADDLWPMAEEQAPFASLQQRRVEKTIREAMGQLPQEQAEILRQIYLQGKTQAEVAQSNDIPLGTVKSRVRLALEKLRMDGNISSLADGQATQDE